MRTPSRVRDFVRCQVIAKHSSTTAGLLRARRLQSNFKYRSPLE
ncbi:MAG TPA: hypothetical protein VFQ03_10790 [Candidatus Binatia bacterium]|nr:hypothetical protein [Candidatus Binatia bacterium]